MNTAPKTAARQNKKIDLRYGNVESMPKATEDLSQPSNSESRWLKSAVPTIGASPDDHKGGEGNPVAQA